MIEVYKAAVEFGAPKNENGTAPVPAAYPSAAERIEGLFDHRNANLTEVVRGLKANMKAEEPGVPKVSTFAKDDVEATGIMQAVMDEFCEPENIHRLFEPVLDSYIDSADEGPVALADMPDISEFDA
jgi:hypothetical protein